MPGGDEHSAVYRVDTPTGSSFALRVRPRGEADDLLRERMALEAAVAADCPCPHVIRIGIGMNAAWILTTWEPGVPVFDVLVQNPERLPSLAAEAGRVAARLHRGAAGISGELRGLELGWATPHSAEERALLAECPPGGPATLIHLDFHPLNLLVTPTGGLVVLDWVNAGIGDARLDVARSAATMLLEAGWSVHPAAPIVDPWLRNWCQGYRDEGAPLDNLAPFLAWAGVATLRDLRPKREPVHIAWMEETIDTWKRGDIPSCLA
jgi:aminoglycoside phosphotransferase (APT) family kinase protein